MKVFGALLLAAISALFLFSGCSDDDSNNNPPVTGTLTGNAIFYGDWPDSGAVQLSIFTNWNTSPCSWCGVAPNGPPAYYTPAGYFTDPNPNNGAGPDTIPFALEGVALGTYAAIATGWRAPDVGDINCDEPVIGLYGAEWGTNDSIPSEVTFTDANRVVTLDVTTNFDILPIPGCDERGRIEGAARVPGTWPAEGLLVMLTTFPVSGWNPIMGQPTDYHIMPTNADTIFRFTPPFGTYYLSIWTNAQPPSPSQWYGSYGIDTYLRSGHPVGTDPHPDGIVLSEATPATGGIIVPGNTPAPHYVSGNVTFNGTRPAEGLLVMLTTTPVSPLQPPQGQPFGYFALTDPNEVLYAICGMPEGAYYVSLWSNTPPPNPGTCYGAYGYTAGSDTIPDSIVLNSTTWGVTNIHVTGEPPSPLIGEWNATNASEFGYNEIRFFLNGNQSTRRFWRDLANNTNDELGTWAELASDSIRFSITQVDGQPDVFTETVSYLLTDESNNLGLTIHGESGPVLVNFARVP